MKITHLIGMTILCANPFFSTAQNDADTVQAWQYYSTGDSLIHLAEYNDASASFQKAGEIYLSLKVWDKYAACLNKLSECSWRVYDIEIADQYLNKALDVCEKYLPDNDSQWAKCFSNRGIIYFYTGQVEKANEELLNALTLQRKVLPESPDLAFTLNSLGIISTRSGDFDISMDYYQQALVLKKKIYGLDHPDVAKTIVSIGVLQMQTQNLDKAIESFLTGLTIYKKTLGSSHPELIPVYSSLGFGYTLNSDYQKGRDYFLLAIENTSNFLGDDNPWMADHYNGMAINHTEKNEYPKALEYYLKAIDTYEGSSVVNHQSIAVVQGNIGSTYLKLQNFQKARLHLEKALSVQKRFKIDDKATTALTYDLLGDVYKGLEEYPQALNYYKKGLKIRSEIFEESNTLLAVSNYSIATSLAAQEEYSEALRYCQKALIINALDFFDTSIYVNPPITEIQDLEVFLNVLQMKAELLISLYSKHGQLSDLEFALSTYQLCDQLVMKMRQSHQRYGDKVKFGETVVRSYAGAIAVSKDLAKIKEDKNYYKSLAFHFAEKSRAAALLANRSDIHARKFSGLPDSLLRKEKALKSDKSYYQSLLLAMKAEQSGYDTIKFNRYQNNLIDASFQLDSLTLIFERNHKKYYQFKYRNATITKDEVQNNLAPNEAFIEYFEDRDKMYVFAITKNNFWIETFKADSVFNNSLDKYMANFDPVSIKRDFAQHYVQFTKTSSLLYEQLLDPILSNLPSTVDHLIIVPTDRLSYAPWGLFIRNGVNDSKGKDYKSLDYLINTYSISYAHSASLLFQYIYSGPNKSKKSVLALAPSYRENANDEYKSLKSTFRDEMRPLKWNAPEIREIGKYFKGSYLTGEQATEANFKDVAGNFSILHLAMHAFVDDENPMQSKLVFFQNNDSIEDGMLHTHELFNMDLSAEMVVLSACNTGLGKTEKGEGIMSLGRAFSYAGCPSVMTSHWSVDDESTSQLMASFYKYLAEGQTKDKSLRQAKLDFLQNTNGLKTHPYYWGGFVVLGETKPLSSSTNMIFIFFAVIMVVIPVVVWATHRKGSNAETDTDT